jgi:hypothetical protein
MSGPGGARTALRAGLIAVTSLVPSAVRAETGLSIRPSLGVARVYDDNLFATSQDRQADLLTRLTPDLDLAVQGSAVRLESRYAFDAEVFARHPELDDSRMRQRGSLDLRAPASGRWSARLGATYADTMTPGELNVETGLLSARARARQVALVPAVTWEAGPSRAANLRYAFTRDEVAGTVTESRVAGLGADRGIGARDTLHFELLDRRFSFSSARGETAGATASEAITLGWTRAATPRTTFSLRAGPRASGGRVEPEASASIRVRLKRGEIAADYADSLTTVVGQAGAASFRSLGLRVAGRPSRALSVSLAPTWVRVRNEADGSISEVAQVGVDTTWSISRWLSLLGSYRQSRQRSSAGAGPAGVIPVARDVVLLSLVGAVP